MQWEQVGPNDDWLRVNEHGLIVARVKKTKDGFRMGSRQENEQNDPDMALYGYFITELQAKAAVEALEARRALPD